jgi:hypothetical protein
VFEKPLAPRAVAVAVAVGLAILIVLASGAQPGYDTSWHLVWAHQILSGHGLLPDTWAAHVPTFDAWAAPTEHPLLMLIALVSALFGTAAPQVMLVFTLLALFGLLEAMRQLGREVFGSGLAGVVGWVLMAGAYGLLLQALRGYLDVWFLLLITIAAMRIARTKQATAGWLPLLLAGLLRPEAWLLAGIALVTGWRQAGRDERRKAIAAVIAPPAIWFSIDALVTGQPLLSLKTASALEVVGSGGPLHVFAGTLGGGLRGPATLLGLIGIGLAWKKLGMQRVRLPLVLIGAGLAMALVIAIGGLTLLPRYLLLCDLGLALFAGYTLGGWTAEANATLWRGAGIAAIAASVVGAIVLGAPSKLADEVALDRNVHHDLKALLSNSKVKEAMKCGPLTFPSFRLIPDAKLVLDDPQSDVRGRAEPPVAVRGVAVTIVRDPGDARVAERYGHPGIDLPIDERTPNGFRKVAADGSFEAAALCGI